MGSCSSSTNFEVHRLRCFYCRENERSRGYGNFCFLKCDYMKRPQINNILPKPLIYQYNEKFYFGGDYDTSVNFIEFPVHYYYLPDCNGCLMRKERYGGKNVAVMPEFKKIKKGNSNIILTQNNNFSD